MGTDIRAQGLNKPVAVAEYLFTRLYQLGIRSIHGLPGDFNLVALDYVPKANLKWVGSVNELNAGMLSAQSLWSATTYLMISLCR
jgi:pyruvate decarboxylase